MASPEQREVVATMRDAVEGLHLRAMSAADEVKRGIVHGLVVEESVRDLIDTIESLNNALADLQSRCAERNSVQRVANDIGGAA